MPRVILFHLAEASTAEVEQFLSSGGFSPPGPPPDDFWRYPDPEDSVLYVAVKEDDYVEFREIDGREYGGILKALDGREPNVSVFVEVSNRHRGFEEVDMLARLLLTRFAGCARDEYSEHHWTLHEMQQRKRFQGHRFFDAPA